MEEDKRIENWLKSQFQPDFNEVVPESFLKDINQRLDAIEKGRKRKIGGWIWSSVFLFSGFIAVAAWLGLQKFAFDNALLTKQISISKKQKVNVPSTLKTHEKKSKSAVFKEIENPIKAVNEINRFSTNNHSIQSNIKIDVENTHLVDSIQDKVVSIDNVKADLFVEKENKVIERSDSLPNKNSLDSLKYQSKKIDQAKKWSWEAGFSFGVSGIISSFEVPANVAQSNYSAIEYRKAREQQERSTTSWDISFRLKMCFKSWTCQSGLDYFQWGEQVKYNFSSISGINRYSYLSVPINIGYDFRKGKFGINPYVGASPSFCFQRKGQYLMADMEHVAQEQAKQVIGTLTIGTEIAYYSDAGLKVFLIPIWRKSLGRVVDSSPIYNKYQSFGMQMGIAIHF